MFPDQRVARPVSASRDNPNQIQNNFEPVEENPEKNHQTLAVEGVKNFTRNRGFSTRLNELRQQSILVQVVITNVFHKRTRNLCKY